jgi:hypothetical protein
MPQLNNPSDKPFMDSFVIEGLISNGCGIELVGEMLTIHPIHAHRIMKVINLCMSHDRLDVIRLILERDRNVRVIDVNNVALHIVNSRYVSEDTLKLFVEYGANNYNQLVTELLFRQAPDHIIRYLDTLARERGDPIDYDGILSNQYGQLTRRAYARLIELGYVTLHDVSRVLYRAASNGDTDIVTRIRRSFDANVYQEAIQLATDNSDEDAYQLLINMI